MKPAQSLCLCPAKGGRWSGGEPTSPPLARDEREDGHSKPERPSTRLAP